jgi:hypothetical protein
MPLAARLGGAALMVVLWPVMLLGLATYWIVGLVHDSLLPK